MTNSTFKTTVYALCKNIPKGKVATYGQIAKLAGNSKASRAVGLFMKHNPDALSIPCHRIVSSSGELTGYAFGNGISLKRKILEKEGIVFQKNKINLSKYQWIPN